MDDLHSPGSAPEMTASPSVPVDPGSGYELSEAMLNAVHTSGPWLRFMSVLGFISLALMLLVGLFMLVAGVFGAALSKELGGAGVLVAMAVMYLALSFVYLFPALYLWRAADGAAESRRGEVSSGVEKALANQKSFWKFVGIVTIVILCLYPVMIIVAVVLPLLLSR